MKSANHSKRLNQIIFFILQTIFGTVLSIIFIHSVNFSKLFYYLAHVSLTWTCLAIFFYLVSAILRIIRFRYLLVPLKKIKWQDACTTSFAGGLLNYLIPLRAGEVGRAWYIKKKYNISLISGTTVSFIDKLFDLFATLIILILFSITLGNLSFFHHLSIVQIILLAVILGIIYLLIFQGKTGIQWLQKGYIPKQIISLAEKVIDGFSVLQIRPLYFSLLLAISVLAMIFDGVFVYFLYVSFGTWQAIAPIILGYALFNFSYIIPAGPGYVGNIELLGVLIFSNLLGLPKEISTTVILYLHLLITLMLSALGFSSLFLLHFQWRTTIQKIFN